MTNLLFFLAFAILGSVILIMAPLIAGKKKLTDFDKPTLIKYSKIILPLMAIFFCLVLIASLNGKFHWY
ncbi:hypothetical protein J2X71_006437 [Rhizobium sp. 1399]|nr:hypothetical protein [Rhizobium sp. 1399]